MLESSSNTSTTTTTTINHSNIKRNNKENQTIADVMAIPISLSSTIQNSNNLVNSVIQQTNQQSVIQSANSVQTLQNNRMDQPTDNHQNNTKVICNDEDESKRRRELLNRRPSYRKILNEISSADTTGCMLADTASDRNNQNENQSQQSSTGSSLTTNTLSHIVVSNPDTTVLSLAQPITVNLSSQSNSTSVTNTSTDQNNNHTIPYLKMIPSMQLTEQDLIPAVQLSNHTNTSHQQSINNHGIVHYGPNHQEAQFFISDSLHWPYRVNSSEFSSYQLRDPATSPVMMNNSNNVSNASSFQSNASSSNTNQHHRSEDEQDKKRQLRLQKNREAAKECRRKKKEYIKCLEDRVNVLATQNKTLIEELKTLKKLYCQQNE